MCTSHEKGCLAFVCDTNHSHSNCLDRFRSAYDVTSSPPVEDTSTSTGNSVVLGSSSRPACPLCRGEVQGWVVIEDARTRLNNKTRCCDEFKCSYTGTFSELQQHVKEEHPHAQPSKVDPARQLDWENFQQSSEIIDVLSTIHSEVPRGVVLGDYVIDYGDNETGDDFEDFPGGEGNWWTSCIIFHVFKKIRSSRSRRRSRDNDRRRGSRHSRNDTSNSDEGSVTSVEFADYRLDELDDELIITRGSSRTSATSRRRRYRGGMVDG
ncbi:hypothetical protein MLD38_006420 [Melastoma candidum]|uniref:Uncharacterized protein n=1 Tax=Melastoma candidum TaxID=119954 RepID=A0ACB9RPR2_9MYRT|nr:hypothetical protein MLD38_006420 [Melastoma candidum]